MADAGGIEVSELEPGEQDQWDRFVLSSPSGTLCHLTGWKTVVESALGHRSFSLVARGERGIRGVFPISWVRNKLFGDCLVSMPLGVYGGVCADDQGYYFSLLQTRHELVD